MTTSRRRIWSDAADRHFNWEIAIKQQPARIDVGGSPELVVPDLMLRSDVTALSVTHQHTLGAAALPRHHRDPFDRLLIAQAQLEPLPIMTADAAFASYDVECLAA